MIGPNKNAPPVEGAGEARDSNEANGAGGNSTPIPACCVSSLTPADHTRAFLNAIAKPGQVIEVRAFDVDKWTRIESGYFNDWPKLIDAVSDLEVKQPVGTFITINPVNTALLARAKNRMGKAQRNATTADADITRRRVLPIDIDSIRPSGISATDAEKGEALLVADAVDQYLHDEGWSTPIFVDSGNGYHLHYRIDMPNDDASAELVKSILANLAEQFDTAGAKVDTSVYNAARIMRLPGTTARKGDNVPDLGRVHRPCKLMEEYRWTR